MKNSKRNVWISILVLVFLAVLTIVLAVTLSSSDLNSAPQKTLWWHNMILYQVYPRSFQDSDGDGTGDIKGISSRLDYLKELGINSVWLSPIYASPMRDFGYDISNQTAVEPLFGTIEDMEALIRRAKELGLRVVLDFVPNHTSNESIWFQKSIQNDADYADFYVWHAGNPAYNVTWNNQSIPAKPNNWVSVFGGSMWEWNPIRKQYYLHQFLVSMPDLNWRNPKVVEAMDKSMIFWLDKNIDGFRIDAIPFLFEIPVEEMLGKNETERNPFELESDLQSYDYEYWLHTFTRSQKETFEQTRKWVQLMEKYCREKGIEEKFLIFEAVDKNISNVLPYYPSDPSNTPAMPFYFNLLLNMNSTTNGRNIDSLVQRWVDGVPEGGILSWVMSNHDQRRIASKVGDSALVDGLNMINLLLPGIPTIYYGEEIGMVDTILTKEQIRDPAALNFIDIPGEWEKKTRDYCRSPMQWSRDEPSANFSSNADTWLPLSPTWKTGITVEDQNSPANNHTHLKLFRELIKLHQNNAFRFGSFKSALVGDDIYSFVRKYRKEIYLVAVDLRRRENRVVLYNFTAAGITGMAQLVLASINAYQPPISIIVEQKLVDLSQVPFNSAHAFVFKLEPCHPNLKSRTNGSDCIWDGSSIVLKGSGENGLLLSTHRVKRLSDMQNIFSGFSCGAVYS